MSVHAISVSVGDSPAGVGPTPQRLDAGGGDGAAHGGPLRLRTIPSTRPGVADVPLSPTGQQRFYAVHEALLSIGARAITGADDFERDLLKDEADRALLELVQMQNGDEHDNGSTQPAPGAATDGLCSLPASQASSSQSRGSEAEVERFLLGSRVTSTQEKSLPPSRAGRAAFHLYGLDEEDSGFVTGEGAEDQDDRIVDPDSSPPSLRADAVPSPKGETEDDGSPGNSPDHEGTPVGHGDLQFVSHETVTRFNPAAKSGPGEAVRARVGEKQVATAGNKAESAAEPSEPTDIQDFLDFWNAHVSKLYPPHVWYRQQTAPSATETSGVTPTSYSCKLTLVMPNATKRTFETAATYTDKSAARLRAFAEARDSEVLTTARKLREQVGWQAEEQETADEREKIKRLKGGERPWETLRAEQEKWMAPPISPKVDKDELNAVFGCTLSIQSSSLSPPLLFVAPTAFPSAREARAVAARLALEAGVPAQYQRAFDDSIKRDQHGYIQVGDITAAEAARDTEVTRPGHEQAVGKDADGRGEGSGGDGEGRLDAVGTLNEHVKAAFGSRKMWVSWTYEHAEQESTKTAPSLGATLTIKIPVTEKHPSAPPPFVVSTERRYRSKHYARLACATSAFENGLLRVLEPYRKEREEAKRDKLEEKARQAEEKRKEREAGRLWETPQAGTVKYEDLALLPNPTTYLNMCAQQWTGNGSPLKFEYTTRTVENSNIKHYGCTLTVFVNISLSRTYEVAPSPEYRNRTAAKAAAVRLALKKHVLDLLTPAGFDPSAPPLPAAAACRVARAARGREPMELDTANKRGGGSEDPAIGASATTSQPKDAVSRLDEFVQDWVGVGCLPQYDIYRDERSKPPLTNLFWVSWLIKFPSIGGLYGGSLCIPFASRMAHEDMEDPSSKLVPIWSRTSNFGAGSVSRTQAQQHFAQSALDEGIIEWMKEQVPRRSEVAPPVEACECGGFGSSTAHKHELSEPEEHGDARAGSTDPEAAKKPSATAATSPRKRIRLDLAEQGEPLVGEEGGSVERLRRGCRGILGDEAGVGPRYKSDGYDGRFGASVTIPLDPEGADWRVFGVPESYPTRDLAFEAAASSALDAGILELIESRVRPKSRVAPPVIPPAPNKVHGSKSDGQAPGVGVPVPVPVPKHGEELAAARRALYGGFGAATAHQLGELTKKIEAELDALQEREEARRNEEKQADELRRMGNPLLPGLGPTPHEALLPSSPKSGGGEGTRTANEPTALAELTAYCDQHALPTPRFFTAPLEPTSTSTASGAARCRVWLFLRGLKFELPRVKTSVAEERLAAKVLAHLQKLDDEEQKEAAAAMTTMKEA
ncbi:hypothetical protein JCM3774_005321 [Rhodotorula dairenensis]